MSFYRIIVMVRWLRHSCSDKFPVRICPMPAGRHYYNMNKEDLKKIEAFIRDTFSDGSDYHELRLSEGEAKYLKETCTGIRLEYFADDHNPDGKLWYRVYLNKPE